MNAKNTPSGDGGLVAGQVSVSSRRAGGSADLVGSSVSSRAVRNPSTARGGVCVPPQRGAKCDSNLVDSASSHTLVSKIKPCMSKYKRIYTVKLRTAH